MINVNQTDYLDYIEGAGVRLVVHHQSEHPFPDTFGYSAPVGAISAFGIKLVRVIAIYIQGGPLIFDIVSFEIIL